MQTSQSNSPNASTSSHSLELSEESANLTPLFDPSTTVTLPDPTGAHLFPVAQTSAHLPPTNSLEHPQADAVGSNQLTKFLGLHPFIRRVFEACRGRDLCGRASYGIQQFQARIGEPNSLERRRAWGTAITLLVAFLVLLDPWQARRVYERPAYEAFLRRHDILRFSTGDVLDGLLTCYLVICCYFI